MLSDVVSADDLVLKSVCNRKWAKQAFNKDNAILIEQKGIDPILSEMLARRSLHCDEVENFLEPKLKYFLPDPKEVKDMAMGVSVVFDAIKKKQSIAVFGDYDVDGATSSALLKRFLNACGHDLKVYIPDRVLEGYGPNIEALKHLKDSGVDLVITVDCGTASHEVIAKANDIGLDMVVLDHHIAERPDLPRARAVINPNRKDDNSGLNDLAAVGVTFLFIIELSKKLKEDDSLKDFSALLLRLLDLVALGTVCDVVPLRGLNRVFVKQGLKVMSQTSNVGLKALIDYAAVKGQVTPYHLGFVLGPRINAGGRVGKSSLGTDLLTCDDYDKAYEIAAMLDSFNSERKLIESQVLDQAMDQAAVSNDSNCIVVLGRGWHQGVIGIVASRIQEKYSKPVIVISVDESGIGKASCRSIHGINIGSLISQACKDGILLKGGGHAMAAGFSIEEKNTDDLKYFLESNIAKEAITANKNKIFTYESLLSSSHVNVDFIKKINMLGPFGNSNETPSFLLKNVVVTDVKIFQSSHISCVMRDADNIASSFFKAIAFRAIESPMGELLLSKGRALNLVVTLGINDWNNLQRPEAVIIDVIE